MLWYRVAKHCWICMVWISQFLIIRNAIFMKCHWTILIMKLLGFFYYLLTHFVYSTLEKNIIISYFSNSALESFRLKFKVNSKDNEPLCNVLCKYKECIRIYYMYTSDCSNRDGFARNTSSSYHTCKHHQSTLNQMNIYLIYY